MILSRPIVSAAQGAATQHRFVYAHGGFRRIFLKYEQCACVKEPATTPVHLDFKHSHRDSTCVGAFWATTETR